MDDLTYLKNLNNIVLPKEFTYLNLDLYYENNSIKEKTASDAVTDINIEKYTFDKLTSFTERRSRMNKFLRDPNSLDVNIPEYSKPFSIRLLIPRSTLSSDSKSMLSIDSKYQDELDKIYSGYGDRDHPKIANTTVYFFGSTLKDEVTEKDIDILYAVREEDINRLALATENSMKDMSYTDLGENLHFNRFLSYGINRSNLYKRSIFMQEYYDELDKKNISGYTVNPVR